MQIKGLASKWLELPIWQKIIIGLILGMVTGLGFGESAAVLKPIGDIFIHALHMVIVPVILSAVVCAVISVTDLSRIKRVTTKAFFIYMSFLVIATLIAIFMGKLIAPGFGMSPEALQSLSHLGHSLHSQQLVEPIHGEHTINSATGVLNTLVEMVPKNPFASFANENILQIVIFGILLGIAINLSGEKGKPVANLFQSLSVVSKNLTNIVMQFAPYGVFALIAWTFGMFGAQAFGSLIRFILTLLLSCITLVFLIYGSIIVLYLKKSPVEFLKRIMPAIICALSTSSSGATLPVSIKVAEQELKVSHDIAKFLLPLGCNFNLSGLAIYLTVAVVFTANMFGVVLNPAQYLFLIATVVLTTMGTGAIPGSAIIVMSAVLTTMGLPLAALPLIAGIDRINDMIQTTTNVISDIFAAYLVSESEKRALGVVESESTSQGAYASQ